MINEEQSMIVLHMDSGLGNQMLDYAEYLAARKSNPGQQVYIEDAYYSLPDGDAGMFAHWNGYELERVFGIKAPFIRDRIGSEAWSRVVQKVRDSEYWKGRWYDYAPITTKTLNDEGFALVNVQKNSRREVQSNEEVHHSAARKLLSRFFTTYPGYQMKRIARGALENSLIEKETAKYDVFQKYDGDVYGGHSLCLKFKGFGIEKIDSEIRRSFTFPEITDGKNQEVLHEISAENAVAIHARRSDMLFLNGYCYQYGFFRRSVRYIRRHTENPVFYFFTDELSRGWCEQHPEIFGLDFQNDPVRFVTWNSGLNSFRDMQLMAQCHHNIFTESSFGFWGAYLNQHEDKITCAPDPLILATNHF